MIRGGLIDTQVVHWQVVPQRHLLFEWCILLTQSQMLGDCVCEYCLNVMLRRHEFLLLAYLNATNVSDGVTGMTPASAGGAPVSPLVS